jgi:cell division septation protein DedD
MRNELITLGYSAYAQQVKGKTLMTRVLVGPKLSKRTIIRDKKRIEKKFNIKALLLEFTPN